jgi:putative addiction module killer protein
MSRITVLQSDEFRGWLHGLQDRRAIGRIASRIRRMEMGNPGEVRQLGGGLVEMKIDYGPGYRAYFVRREASIILLLCGGDKSTQRRDIDRARKLAETLRR